MSCTNKVNTTSQKDAIDRTVAMFVFLSACAMGISLLSILLTFAIHILDFSVGVVTSLVSAESAAAFLFFAYIKNRSGAIATVSTLGAHVSVSQSIIDDLTKESEETTLLMEQVSHHFNELFRKIPAPCFCYDSDGRFKEWNHAFEKLTMLEPRTIINEPVWSFVKVDGDPGKMESLVQSVINGETYEGIELQTYSSDGEDKTILCNMFPLRGERGNVTAAICAGIDISERIRLEQRMLNHVELLSTAQLQLEEQHEDLLAANSQLEMLAMSDSLTGLKNHRALQERLLSEYKRSFRYGLPVSLLLLDVDHFKKYNDTYGHLAGDTVLRAVGDCLAFSMRDTDFVARYGGEEFVVLLPHTDFTGSLEAAERVRASIEASHWDFGGVTVSIGVATLKSNMPNPSDLIARADVALYYCKQNGRNQVFHAEDLPKDSFKDGQVLSGAGVISEQ